MLNLVNGRKGLQSQTNDVDHADVATPNREHPGGKKVFCFGILTK